MSSVSTSKVSRSDRSISVSEIKRFCSCRLAWFWGSAPPRGKGLAPHVDSAPLRFGRIFHETLQDWYDLGLPITDILTEKFAAFEPPEGVMYRAARERNMEELKKGLAIAQMYADWAERGDQAYTYLSTESVFKNVEVPGTKGTVSAVIDTIVERPDGLWVMDFKTTSSRSVSWTVQDPQATLYTYIGRKLVSKDIQGTIFRFVLKSPPHDYHDLILKSGKITTRKNLGTYTTFSAFYRAVAIATLKYMVEETIDGVEDENGNYIVYSKDLEGLEGLDRYNEALSWVKHLPAFKKEFIGARRIYFDQLQELRDGEDNFVWEVPERRTDVQVSNYLKHFIAPIINEILNVKWIGPTGLSSAFANCARCAFRNPCRLALDGADYQTALREDYAVSDHYKAEAAEIAAELDAEDEN